jgi:hypothetical protein
MLLLYNARSITVNVCNGGLENMIVTSHHLDDRLHRSGMSYVEVLQLSTTNCLVRSDRASAVPRHRMSLSNRESTRLTHLFLLSFLIDMLAVVILLSERWQGCVSEAGLHQFRLVLAFVVTVFSLFGVL